ncbi:MAG: hypothetical protein WBH40_12665 [Ignavibacteriaceae bacterium]
MKMLIFLFVLLLQVLPTQNIQAQQWTPEQKEVWAIVEATWQADKDGKNWVEEYSHPDILGWSFSYPMPRNKSNANRWFNANKAISKILEYQVSPVGIIVKDKIAIAHYYARVLNESYDGKKKSETSRWTDILIKEGDIWLYIAYQGGEINPTGN